MKYIKKIVDQIDDELHSAKCYAEKYVELKASGDQEAATYKNMAGDELEHANELHRIIVGEIGRLNKIYTPPEDMQEKWEKSHANYVEKAAWIKQMLAL